MTPIDEEIDRAVGPLGLAFNGLDDNVLSFVALEGESLGESTAVTESIISTLRDQGILEHLPANVNAVRIDAD